MRFLLLILAFFIGLSSLFAVSVSDRIEMGVSPIRHELTVTPWVPTQKSITFFNNADVPYDIYLTAEDCTADSLVGTPRCQVSPNVVGDPRYLSTWISFVGSKNITVPPKSEVQVLVNINPPSNAIPGGHYGAIFFNRPTGTADANTVKMIQRIGTLFLVTVPWTITYNTVYGTISIWPGGGGWAGGVIRSPEDINGAGYPEVKKTPEYWITQIKTILDPTFNAPSVPPVKDFSIDMSIPVKNEWNIHILPVGRVEILDENGMPLKSIWKESIRSQEWAYVGEKIVDYLPINDEAGNVLPNSERVYNISWKGFAYETIDGWKAVIKFLSPQDYYKQVQSQDSPYLLPWEKYRVVPVSKKFNAKIYIEYSGEWNTPVPYEVERVLDVSYLSLEKSINYGAILIVFGIFIIFWLIIAARRRDDRISYLEEEVWYIEAEVDELEKGRVLAKKALAKKAEKIKTSPKEPTTEINPTKTVKKSTPKKDPDVVVPKKKPATRTRTKSE